MPTLAALLTRVRETQEHASNARPHIRDTGEVSLGLVRSNLDALELELVGMVDAESAAAANQAGG